MKSRETEFMLEPVDCVKDSQERKDFARRIKAKHNAKHRPTKFAIVVLPASYAALQTRPLEKWASDATGFA